MKGGYLMANYKCQNLIRLLQAITNCNYESFEYLLEDYSNKFPHNRKLIHELSFIAYSDYPSKYAIDNIIRDLKKSHKAYQK